MTSMQAPVTHILPLTHIRRARLLKIPGRVLVKVGQKVSPTDAVAESFEKTEHVLIDVRRALRLKPAELAKAIERKPGERIQKDDVLAQVGGLFQRVVRSPVDGEIVAIQNGQVLIELPAFPVRLLSGLAGEVAQIVPERGVVIEASGALIQGVWGNGQRDMGTLVILSKSADEVLLPDRLDVSQRGLVVVAGRCESEDVFTAGAQLPLRGLILGSMPSELIGAARKVGFPVILLEGFGQTPMNSAAFKLLATNDKRDAAIDACVWDPFSADRPEIFIELPAEGQAAPEVSVFSTGKAVRAVAAPYEGKLGTIMNVLPGLVRLKNGLRAPVADVRLEDNQVVTIPLANLDVLE